MARAASRTVIYGVRVWITLWYGFSGHIRLLQRKFVHQSLHQNAGTVCQRSCYKLEGMPADRGRGSKPGRLEDPSEELRNALFQHHNAVLDSGRARFLLQQLQRLIDGLVG